MIMSRLTVAGCVEIGDDGTGKIGVRGIDPGIDDGDENPVAPRQAVSLR